MNLSLLTDEELDAEILASVRVEAKSTTAVLHHLREVDRRKLYSKLRFDSLFAYAVKRLGYSEDAACRRISAMRLLAEVPEIEVKLQTGALTLSHLNKAQMMFRREKKERHNRSPQSKLHILQQIERLPIREVEKKLELETLVPQPKKETQPISLDQFSERVRNKLKRLLEVRSHTLDRGDLNSLIEQMADTCLANWDPLEKAERRTRQKTDLPATSRVKAIRKLEKKSAPVRPHIPSKIRHALYLRDHASCQNCGSREAIQIDHILPFLRGGTNEISNLRLLCRSCNLRHAVETYGIRKMKSYLREPAVFYAG